MVGIGTTTNGWKNMHDTCFRFCMRATRKCQILPKIGHGPNLQFHVQKKNTIPGGVNAYRKTATHARVHENIALSRMTNTIHKRCDKYNSHSCRKCWIWSTMLKISNFREEIYTKLWICHFVIKCILNNHCRVLFHTWNNPLRQRKR